MKTMSRSAGRSVVAAAAYRLGEALHEVEIDQMHDYRRRGGVAEKLTFAPADAPAWASDPEQLWNAANAAEKRKNSTLAREVELALPASVSPEARTAIVRVFAQELVDRYGVAVSVGIHAPSRGGDQRNHHAHILFTTRRMEAEGLTTKTRVLDDRKTGPQEVVYLRALASDLINAALEDAGSDERVDHRSFAARGIEQEPTTHLGPAGTALERREAASERGEINDNIATRNRALDNLVEELAALDREINAELEQQLDDRFGAAEPGSDQSDAPGEDFELVHQEAADPLPPPDIDEGLSAPPTATGDATFDAVHNQTIMQAAADQAVIDVEEAGDGSGGFRRVVAWWRNMREHFVEWRDHLHEHFLGRPSPPPASRDEIEH